MISLKHQDTILNLFWKSLHVLGKQGITFVSFILCANLLSPHEFGVYNYVFSIILVLILFGDFGISSATAKFVAEYQVTDQDLLKRVPFNALLILLATTSIAALILLVFGGQLLGENFHYVLYILPIIFFAPLTAVFDGIYMGLSRFKELAIISFFTGISTVLILYIAITSFGLVGALATQTFFYLALSILLMIRFGKFSLRYDGFLIRTIGHYSLIIGVAVIGFILFTRVDAIFLGYYGYIQEVGYFEIINKILIISMLPFGIVAQVIAPVITKYYSQNNITQVLSKFKRYLLFSVLASSVLTLIIFVSKDLIISRFFAEYYNDNLMWMFTLLLIAHFTQMITGVFSVGFVTATGHARFTMHFLLFFGILHLLLNFVLIELFGYMGIIYSVIITKVIADVSYLLIYYLLLHKQVK
ncbi:MAG TPA: lipopolysaccharide biosynthesis protein [Candidatus Paceibacterota bacterium]|nr:lipopolysaccharide biosynthesis protein [Candidatus Paceibacterota bacterium]